MFSLGMLRGKMARGLPELTPSRTPDVGPLCCLLPGHHAIIITFWELVMQHIQTT